MIDPAPNIPDSPAILPKAPDMPATSASAPPIPVSPFAISFQDIPPNCFNAFPRSPSPLIRITIVSEPNIPDKPDSLPRTPAAIATSVSAPPIPESPRPISLQDMLPNCLSESAILLND